MSTDIDENPAARRLRIRRTGPRGRGFVGGGSSNSTRAEGMRSSADDIDDEVDDAIDPERVHDHVTRRAAAPPADLDVEGAPARRLAEVRNAGSRAYAKEHRLNLLHRFLVRGISLDKIAQQLGCSISTLEKDRVELKKRLREEARGLHIDEMVGGQTAFYDDVTAMAMRIASFEGGRDPATNQVLPGNPLPMRLAGLRTALAANADKNRFYTSAGVYDANRFRRGEDGSGQTDINILMERTREMLGALAGDGFAFSDHDQPLGDLDGPLVEEL